MLRSHCPNQGVSDSIPTGLSPKLDYQEKKKTDLILNNMPFFGNVKTKLLSFIPNVIHIFIFHLGISSVQVVLIKSDSIDVIYIIHLVKINI
jgi:hypothetical protein